MSVRMSAAVWDDGSVRGTDKLLLLAIADHANDEGVCWPSYERLAQMVGVTVRQAQRLVQRLEAQGKLVVHRVAGRARFSRFVLVLQGAGKGDTAMSPFPEKKGDAAMSPFCGKGDTAMSPFLPPKKVTSGAEKVTSGAEKVTSSAQKGDILSHARGEPTTEPTTEPIGSQSSSSVLNARYSAAKSEDEDDEDDGFFDDEEELLVRQALAQLEYIAQRPATENEARELGAGALKYGAAAVGETLKRLAGRWHAVVRRDDVSRWLASTLPTAVPARPALDTPEARRRAYVPAYDAAPQRAESAGAAAAVREEQTRQGPARDAAPTLEPLPVPGAKSRREWLTAVQAEARRRGAPWVHTAQPWEIIGLCEDAGFANVWRAFEQPQASQVRRFEQFVEMVRELVMLEAIA